MFSFKNKKVALLGWGINGLDALNFLLKEGAKVTILDFKEEQELDLKNINKNEVGLSLGESYLSNGLADYDFVFRAPGVYRYLPQIVQAEKSGTVVTSVVNVFFDLCPAKIIGVTGTKGKGTTSTLIYEILKKDKKDAFLAGNIGVPMLELLPKLKSKSFVVLELSSFQLIDLIKGPHVAVVLNITEDHMDWHKNRNEYVEAKKQIVLKQTKNDFSVLANDYLDSKSFSKVSKGKVYYFSRVNKTRGAYVEDGKIYLNVNEKAVDIGNTAKLLLRGKHNWENVCAAAISSFLAGASIGSIRSVVFSFKGLEHRLELVREVKGVCFYNDSFSTNPQTTIAAIHSFEEPLTLILGGSDKGLNYDNMGREVSSKKNIKNIVLIGDISEKIEKSLKKAKSKNAVFRLGYPDMKNLVKKCFKETPNGGVVLLSPATASFDMFANYKERGKKFKEDVKSLSF